MRLLTLSFLILPVGANAGGLGAASRTSTLAASPWVSLEEAKIVSGVAFEGVSEGLPEAVAHMAGCHSGEGELVVRSLENTVVHHADYAFWRSLDAGGMLEAE